MKHLVYIYILILVRGGGPENVVKGVDVEDFVDNEDVLVDVVDMKLFWVWTNHLHL